MRLEITPLQPSAGAGGDCVIKPELIDVKQEACWSDGDIRMGDGEKYPIKEEPPDDPLLIQDSDNRKFSHGQLRKDWAYQEPSKLPEPVTRKPSIEGNKKRVCSLPSCAYCCQPSCGSCCNCLNPGGKNKCLKRMCPRLNRKKNGKSWLPNSPEHTNAAECFTCPICGNSFGYKSNLHRHMKTCGITEEPVKPFYMRCGICCYQSTSRKHMRIHFRAENHETNEHIFCGQCDKMFRRMNTGSFRIHRILHHPESYVARKQHKQTRGYSFNKRQWRAFEVSEKSKEAPDTLIPSVSAVVTKETKARGSKPRVCGLSSCSYCYQPNCGSCCHCLKPEAKNKCLKRLCPRLNQRKKKSRIWPTDLASADEEEEDPKAINVCTMCGKRFGYLSNLYRHMRVCEVMGTEEPVKSYYLKCDECSFTSMSRKIMSKHYFAERHEANGNAYCAVCHKRFKGLNTGGLRMHRRLYHPEAEVEGSQSSGKKTLQSQKEMVEAAEMWEVYVPAAARPRGRLRKQRTAIRMRKRKMNAHAALEKGSHPPPSGIAEDVCKAEPVPSESIEDMCKLEQLDSTDHQSSCADFQASLSDILSSDPHHFSGVVSQTFPLGSSRDVFQPIPLDSSQERLQGTSPNSSQRISEPDSIELEGISQSSLLGSGQELEQEISQPNSIYSSKDSSQQFLTVIPLDSFSEIYQSSHVNSCQKVFKSIALDSKQEPSGETFRLIPLDSSQETIQPIPLDSSLEISQPIPFISMKEEIVDSLSCDIVDMKALVTAPLSFLRDVKGQESVDGLNMSPDGLNMRSDGLNVSPDDLNLSLDVLTVTADIKAEPIDLHDITTSRGDRPLICPKCGARTKYSSNLRRHMKICGNQKEDEQKSFYQRCDECSFQTTYRRKLAQHCYSKGHAPNTKVYCAICHKVFKNLNSGGFRVHRILQHPELAPPRGVTKPAFSPPQPEREEVGNSEKEQVMREDPVLPQPKSQPVLDKQTCPRCGKRLGSVSNLKRHIKVCDRAVEPERTYYLRCSVCPFRTMSHKNLSRHSFMEQHQPNPLVFCAVCHKSFKSLYAGGLRVHRIFHHPELMTEQGRKKYQLSAIELKVSQGEQPIQERSTAQKIHPRIGFERADKELVTPKPRKEDEEKEAVSEEVPPNICSNDEDTAGDKGIARPRIGTEEEDQDVVSPKTSRMDKDRGVVMSIEDRVEEKVTHEKDIGIVPPKKDVKDENDVEGMTPKNRMDEHEKGGATPSEWGEEVDEEIDVKKSGARTQQQQQLCGMAGCPHCLAENCGQCYNCLHLQYRNRCQVRICPRLNENAPKMGQQCTAKTMTARLQAVDEVSSCPQCGKSFKLKGNLTRHIKYCERDDTKEKPFYMQCDACPFRSMSRKAMSQHSYKEGHPPNENVYCKLCHKVFKGTYSGGLRVHRILNHPESYVGRSRTPEPHTLVSHLELVDGKPEEEEVITSDLSEQRASTTSEVKKPETACHIGAEEANNAAVEIIIEECDTSHRSLTKRAIKDDIVAVKLRRLQRGSRRKKGRRTRPRRCRVPNCVHCLGLDCGLCRNCLHPEYHNRCVTRICPRLNKKSEQLNPIDPLDPNKEVLGRRRKKRKAGGQPANPEYCAKCGRNFTSRNSLTRHLKICDLVVEREKPYYFCCEICGLTSTSRRVMERHFFAEQHVAKEKVHCAVCHKHFNTPPGVIRHSKLVHRNKKIVNIYTLSSQAEVIKTKDELPVPKMEPEDSTSCQPYIEEEQEEIIPDLLAQGF